MGTSASLCIGVAVSVASAVSFLGACATSTDESTGEIGERSSAPSGPWTPASPQT